NRDLLLFWKELPDTLRRRATQEHIFLQNLPVAAQPRARSLVTAMLGSAAPLVLSNARLHVDPSLDTFALTVTSLEGRTVVRRLELSVSPIWQARLKQRE